MDEVKRFLRFTLPGIVALAQFLIAVYLTAREQIPSIPQQPYDPAGVAFVAIGALLTSGAIGYVLGSAYHALNWALPWPAIDHLTTVKELMVQGKLELTDCTGKQISHNALNKRDAWMIWTYYFYANVKDSKELTGLQQMSDRLVDFAHASGTNLVGTALGFLLWVCVRFVCPWVHMGLEHVSQVALLDIVVFFSWILLGWIYFYLQRLNINANESISTAGVLAHMQHCSGFPVAISGIRKCKTKDPDSID